MSEFLHTPLNTVFDTKWDQEGRQYKSYFRENLPKEHTYVLVFTRSYEHYLGILKEQPNVKILYETPYAINTYHGGVTNRQKLVVWEFTDDEQVPQV